METVLISYKRSVAPPSDFGVKAAGTETQYSAPVNAEGVVLLNSMVR